MRHIASLNEIIITNLIIKKLIFLIKINFHILISKQVMRESLY